MNAKILLELPGVEAGSKECGKCRWVSWSWPSSKYFCGAFVTEDGEYRVCTRLDGAFLHPLRCPKCLAAEVKVPDCPTLADLGYHILRKLGFDGLYLGKTCSCGEKENLMDKCSADLSYPPKFRAGYRQPDGTIGPKKEKP